jgi:hypothetical protein
MLTGAVDYALHLHVLAAAVTAIIMDYGVADPFTVGDSYRQALATLCPVHLRVVSALTYGFVRCAFSRLSQ